MSQSQQMDYQKDVLRFKQLWNQMKNPPKGNLETIEEKPDKKNQRMEKLEGRNNKINKIKKKTTIVSDPQIQRNPKANSNEVIEVQTKPHSSFKNKLENEKNNQGKQCLIMTNIRNSDVNEVTELKKTIEERNYQLSLLRVSNTRNQDKIRQLEAQIQIKDQEISKMKARERQLISQTSSLNSKEFNFNYGKVQYQNFKNDTRRLLKMLQQTTQYQQFAALGLADDGVRFLHELNKKAKTRIDKPNTPSYHFCTCNKEIIPEQALWVPDKAYSHAKQFLKSRNGEITHAEMELLIYDLNRMWRQRQKRIINNLKCEKATQVESYKRKVKNLSRDKSD